MRKFDSFLTARGSNINTDEENMLFALEAAKNAPIKGHIPIGAAIVWPSKHIAEHDTTVDTNSLHCASFNVVLKATEMLPHRVKNGIMYCTVEPNAMSVLTARQAGIREVVFGAYDLKNGFISSPKYKVDTEAYDIVWKGGVLAEQCYQLLPKDIQEYASVQTETIM